MGECLLAQERAEEAEALLVESCNELAAALGKEDQRTREALRRLVKLYEATGRPDVAEEYARRADSSQSKPRP